MILVWSATRWSPKEFKGLVHGDYGKTPAPIKKEFSDFILKGEKPITCRFADTLEPEMDKLKAEAAKYAIQEEDVLTYAMFPQVPPSSLRSAMPVCRVWMHCMRITRTSLILFD